MALELEVDPNPVPLDESRLPAWTQADDPAPSRVTCSVGIMAYNEEANIAHAIATVFEDAPVVGEIAEVIVVASGCTDRTAEIVEALARHEPRLRLIVEEHRAGKASAINRFIAATTSPVLMLVNADNVVRRGTIDALLRHFRDPTVGMVGGHPIPVNDDDHFLGFAVHLLWRLHDEVARQCPKLGEIVAFRNVLTSIPTDTAVDELSLQAMLTARGYQLVYEPHAVVYNRGPTTVSDFLRQRRRISAGHLRLAKDEGYSASTMSTRRIGRAVLASDCLKAPNRQPLWTVGTVSLEATARALGYYDYLRHRSHHVWTAVATTKHDIGGREPRTTTQHVLVFQLVDFPEHRISMGANAARGVLERAAQSMRRHLDSRASVTAQDNGTIIVTLAGERADAERTARRLLGALSSEGADDRTPLEPMHLAGAIVSFPERGAPVAGCIPDTMEAQAAWG
jgi:poly-beta-1,6-N-acetyl-D-glucosamine synthase